MRCRLLATLLVAATLVPVATLVPTGGASAASGGYSRPSAPSYSTSRTPSVSAARSDYARPSERTPSVLAPSRSAGDVAISKRSSDHALAQMREQQAERRAETTRQAQPERPHGGPDVAAAPRGEPPRRPDGRFAPYPTTTGWTPSPTIVVQPSYGGGWNPYLMWYLMETTERSDHAAWMRAHQEDPGYVAWRRDADRQAADNPEIRAKLDRMDRQVASAQPSSNPDQVPDDVDATLARVSTPPTAASVSTGSSHIGLLLVVLLLAGGGAVAFILLSHRPRTPPMTGSLAAQLGTAKAIVAGKLGTATVPERKPFRVGQVVGVDPSPFILAGDALLTPAPKDAKTTVATVGRFADLPISRLYLDEGHFLQVHLADDRSVDECRYFALLDTITPGSADEWSEWLDPAKGMIGFGTFDTKDGKAWERVWSPGPDMVEAVKDHETRIGAVGHEATVSLTMMLYARPTGAADPAPAQEYLLVAANEGADGSYVTLHTGIDVPAAGLGIEA